MITTIRTSKDNGPYWDCTKGSYQAATLRDLLFHVRLAMEDDEDLIGVFDAENNCRGIWINEVEGHYESDGSAVIDHQAYCLMRPTTKEQKTWDRLQGRLS